MERYTRQRQTEDHARRCPNHNPPPAYDVDILERDEREKKVSAGNYKSYSRRLIKSNRFEECRGVVHQRVESAQLLERL